MNLAHFNRRLHLYLAMALVPWFLMYGVSSLVFSHPELLAPADAEKPDFTTRFERPYAAPLAPDADRAAREQFARTLVTSLGLPDRFGVGPVTSRGTLDIWCPSFRAAVRLVYDLNARSVKVEDRRFRWDHFLTGAHARGGFQHGFADDLWAVLVDVVCLGFFLWAVTGITMWWKLPRLRRWGAVALGAGAACFAVFMLVL